MPPTVYPTGTTIYYPEKCWNGYTLFSRPACIRQEAREPSWLI